MGYTQVFGGSTIQPSEVSYSTINTAVDLPLVWPKEAPEGNVEVTKIVDVTAQVAGIDITLPPADEVSVGMTIVWNNVGLNSFNVLSATGVTLLTVTPGTVWTLYLVDNGSANGAWRSYQNGASTSQAQAANLAGFGLVATGATLSTATPVIATAVTPTNLTAASRASLIRWTGGAGTLTFDAAATLGNNWFVEVRNDGSGVWTLDPNGGELINGAATLALQAGQSCLVVCDGVGFYTVGLATATAGGSSFDFDNVNVAGTGVFTLSGSDLNRVAYKFTGVLTGNRQVVVPNTIQQYWVDNSTTGAFTLEVKTAAVAGVLVTQGQRAILYCDGTTVLDADTQGISTPLSIAQGGTNATTAAGARTNLGSTATGDALYTAASAAAARTTLGSTATGDALFIAASAAAARATLDAAALATANAFTAAQTVTLTGLTAESTLVSTDAGAAEAVAADLYRNSASPAANDLLMSVLFSGQSNGPAKRTFAKLLAQATAITNTTETGRLFISIMGATTPGTVGDALIIGPGLQVGPAPSGGDKGVGTINSQSLIYQNNVRVGAHSYAAKTADYTPVAADDGGSIVWTTAGFSALLPAAATIGAGFRITLRNGAGSNDVTINPNGAELIDGVATRLLRPGDTVTVECDGAGWFTVHGRYSFTQTGVAFSTSSATAAAHGMGNFFSRFKLQAVARCTTAELGYSIGDTVVLSGEYSDKGATAAGIGFAFDNVNVTVLQSSVNYKLLNKGAPVNSANINNARWVIDYTVWDEYA